MTVTLKNSIISKVVMFHWCLLTTDNIYSSNISKIWRFSQRKKKEKISACLHIIWLSLLLLQANKIVHGTINLFPNICNSFLRITRFLWLDSSWFQHVFDDIWKNWNISRGMFSNSKWGNITKSCENFICPQFGQMQ